MAALSRLAVAMASNDMTSASSSMLLFGSWVMAMILLTTWGMGFKLEIFLTIF